MKFNIEVEIDWIGEDNTLDDIVKKEIVNKVIQTAEQKINEQIDKTIQSKMDKQIDIQIKQLIRNFMNRKFVKTTRYGEIQEETTLKQYLEESFDEYWKREVDKDGRPDGYGANKPRIKWLIDHQIEQHAKLFAELLTKDTENKIKTNMRESLSRSIGAKLVAEFGFDKLLAEKN